MEIIPFLRLSGRRILLLWIVGGTAAALAGTYARNQPVTSTASTSVFLERVYPGDRYDREAFVANYQSAAESLSLVHEVVGQQLGVDAATVANGVKVTVPDKADIVYVRFESTDPDLAQRAASATASETLRALIRTELDSAKASFERATLAAREAEAQLRAEQAPFGVSDLGVAFANLDNQVMALEADLAKTSTEEPTRANLEALLNFRREQRATLSAALPNYQRALVRYDTAEATAQRAQLTFDAASERMIVAQNDEAILPTGVRAASVTEQSIRYAVAAAIAVTALVLMGFFVIEAVSQSAHRRRIASLSPTLVSNDGRVDPPTPLYPGVAPPLQTPAAGARRSG